MLSRREYVTEAAIVITLTLLNVAMWCRAWLRQTWREAVA
jgi:hypothetical protein